MALMTTPAVQLGWQAVDFHLPATDGQTYRLADVRGPNGLLVMFICNHCPYVQAIASRLVPDMRTLQADGIGVIAIMPNDTSSYPDDSFPKMQDFARHHGLTFPYAIDETQAVARAYDAVCTPDFFGFDRELKLRYRGRLDASRKEPAPADAPRELVEAMRQVARTGQGPAEQHPSMGCSIKWKQAA